MRKVVLEIKAGDFVPGGYINGETCPITKALQRAGINAKDNGAGIVDKNKRSYIALDTKSYEELRSKVISMFCTVDEIVYKVCGEYLSPIPVEDFTHVLYLDI